MIFRSLASAALAATLVLTVGAQAPKAPVAGPPTFEQFLATMPWDPAKQGPLVAVEPLVYRRGNALADFGQKTIPIGGLTAVVPLRMTVVDSKIKEPPNFYEGLPQDDKMLYLLASLTPDQWQKATGEGISMADCQGEQALVFDSILPNPFRYSLGTVVDERGIQGSDKPEEKHALTGADRQGIRLRIVRQLELTLALKDDRGYTGGDVDDGRKKGDRVPFVEGEEERKKAFGHVFLTDAPNAPRPSQLDLRDARLGASVPLKKGDDVKGLLGRIALATGVRLVADPHYARTPLFELGETAVARDLLGTLTLGVAGTFRRVGDDYVLTNDLEGMAAHQARIAAFVDAAKKEVNEREKGWRKAIVLSGGFRKIGFHGAAYEGLTEAERTNLESSDHTSQGDNPYIPVSQTSPAVRAGLMRGAQGLEIDKEKVSLRSSVRCEIVLPDGSTTWWANWLGSADEFTDKPYEPNRSRPPVPLPMAATPRLAGLILHADTPAEARARVERVARLGVPAIWLETLNPDALAAAVAAGGTKGVKVSLAVRPWAASSTDPDRTATGAHGKSLAAQKADLGPWNEYWNDAASFQPLTRERLAPFDPAASARISALAGLAATKGLASVVALDLYGPGYAKASGNSYGDYYYSPPVDNFLAYGYTDAQRTAFFRQEGVDPLDVENPMLSQDVDLRGAWGDAWINDDAYAKWQKARGAWAHDAALRLAHALATADPSRPVLLGFQPPVTNVAPFLNRYLLRWDPSGDVPTASEDFGGDETEKMSAFKIIELQDDADATFRNRVAWVVSKHLGAPGTPLVLDLSSVPSARLETVISRWLRDRTP